VLTAQWSVSGELCTEHSLQPASVPMLVMICELTSKTLTCLVSSTRLLQVASGNASDLEHETYMHNQAKTASFALVASRIGRPGPAGALLQEAAKRPEHVHAHPASNGSSSHGHGRGGDVAAHLADSKDSNRYADARVSHKAAQANYASETSLGSRENAGLHSGPSATCNHGERGSSSSVPHRNNAGDKASVLKFCEQSLCITTWVHVNPT
jgi:hypothetical protein